ncbi:hypothetical protein MYX84_00275 [Acidobacteria bacterium AH-259-O06]|nr:hypothetical protein [Acidobacteria bacterium AH-259-O06]
MTVTELVFAEQFEHLREIVAARNWELEQADGSSFILRLQARDNSYFWLKVECNDYPAQPPAWHWYNPDTGALDQPPDTPRGSNFFHGSGRICAPWNRLAYSSYDPNGPHGDWQFANWITNAKTASCTTLAAMALRLAVELHSTRFRGRMN